MLKKWENAYRWQYKAFPFFTSVYVSASTAKFKGKYSVYWGDFLNYFENGNLIAFKQSGTILTVGKRIIREMLAGNDEYLCDLKKLHRELQKVIIKCEKNGNFKSDHFEKLWAQISPALSHTANLLFSFDYPFDNFLNQLRIKDQKNFEYITDNIKNNRSSFMSAAASYLLGLDKKYTDFEIILKKFNEKFSWFQNTYAGPIVIDRVWLKNYLHDLKSDFGATHNKVKKNNKPNKLKPLIRLASYAAVVRDDKKKLLLLAVDLMDAWLKSICKQHKVDYKLLRWLTVDEVNDLIFNNKTFYLIAAKKYENDKRRIGLMLSPGYTDVNKNIWEKIVKINDSKQGNILQGVPASSGIYSGKVRVVLDIKKGSKTLKKGEILVTSMTRPEYLSLMSKAGAFITEEGGISCHAAIVAREMRKPCIIGVKNATKFLKDGDKVTVDGDTGLIKK